jgi:uncharacterized membrane protein
MRMRKLAYAAVNHGHDLGPEFWRLRRIWIALGVPAFIALVIVFYLMVAKPN